MKTRFIIALMLFTLAAVAVVMHLRVGMPENEEQRGVVLSASTSTPLRLARVLADAERGVASALESIPLDNTWQSMGEADIRAESDGLHVVSTVEPVWLERDVSIEARGHVAMRVRMRVERGGVCRLRWAGALAPNLDAEPGVSARILADGAFHTYDLRLNNVERRTWVGRMERIAFQPSDEPGAVTIEALHFVPPEHPVPARITLGGRTHEALFGTQPAWSFAVPAQGVFEVQLGMDRYAWEGDAAGRARFRAALISGSGSESTLVDKTLAPKDNESDRLWRRFQADLAPYAGQEVQIVLDVDPLGSTVGDYAYWGAPLVFQRGRTDAAPVIIVSWDTVRASQLSCYGYERATTPHLDRWTEECVVFDAAISEETYTLPSHMSMLTGLYPKNHGTTADANLAESVLTLAEALSAQGYLTAGFMSFTWWLMPWRGFAQGFDCYDLPDTMVRDVWSTQRLACDWLDHHRASNFFLLVHNFDAHAKPVETVNDLPYGPHDPAFLHFANDFANPPTFRRFGDDGPRAEGILAAANRGEIELTDEEVAYCVALYDDCIRMIDRATFELIDDLKARGLYDNALIIVTADHGEEFGEHDWFGHGTVYEGCCRVPLIVKFPGRRFAGQRYAAPVQLCDLYPTVLDVLGVPAPEGLDGRSLLALLDTRAEPHPFAYSRRLHYRAVRTQDWKYIHSGRDRSNGLLFDLGADPHERSNVYADKPSALQRLQDAYAKHHTPLETGWHLLYRAAGQKTEGRVLLSTEDRFHRPVFDVGDRIGVVKAQYGSREVVLDLDVMDYGEHMTLATASGDARVFLRLDSGAGIDVWCGPDLAENRTHHQVLLDPANAVLRDPPSVDAEGVARPTLIIWHVPPERAGSAAPDIPEEAREALEALGYLNDGA